MRDKVEVWYTSRDCGSEEEQAAALRKYGTGL